MHACMCTHTHTCVVNTIISCKWPPPLGETLGIPYDVICTYACMRMHVHMCGGYPLISPHPHTHPHPPGGTSGISQNSIALELIEIFQFCLKIWNLWRLPHPWVGVWFGGCWVGGWVGWWVGSGQNTKNLKIVDWIKIIQFCLKIYDCRDTPTHGWVCGWLGGSVGQWIGLGQMTNNWINLDLTEIIQFCLKIYHL